MGPIVGGDLRLIFVIFPGYWLFSRPIQMHGAPGLPKGGGREEKKEATVLHVSPAHRMEMVTQT